MISPATNDLQFLHTFFIAATSRTYTEAAERLCLSQSAISHAMAKLERSLGLELWERTGTNVRLNDAGHRLLESCERIFDEWHSCRDQLHSSDSGSLTGTLRIGATVEFGNAVLTRNLRPFLVSHPNLDLQLTCSHDLFDPLLAGILDAIIDCWPHPRSDLWSLPLFQERYVLVVAQELALSANIRRLRDLQSVTWLSLDAGGAWWHRFLEKMSPGEKLKPPRFFTINHLRGMINLAVAGVGVALVPA